MANDTVESGIPGKPGRPKKPTEMMAEYLLQATAKKVQVKQPAKTSKPLKPPGKPSQVKSNKLPPVSNAKGKNFSSLHIRILAKIIKYSSQTLQRRNLMPTLPNLQSLVKSHW